MSEGSDERLKTTMHAAAGTENEPPGPGSTGQYEPGIWRDDDDGRSIDSSGVGGVAAACWRQRSTLKATPPWPFAHSRERMPLRSEPTNASGGGHTRSETRSVVFGVDDLSFRCPVCTRTATRSLSSEYTSVPHSWFSFTGFPSPDRYLDGSSTSTSEFIFFLSAGTTHGAYTRTSGSEASARAFFAPAPSAASGAPRFITHAEEGARKGKEARATQATGARQATARRKSHFFVQTRRGACDRSFWQAAPGGGQGRDGVEGY